MTRLPRLLLVAVLAALALSVSATPAAAKSRPCWAAVINDWYDNGRMDRDYPIACYQEALQHLPPDVREYADAQDVIGRALSAAIARQGQNKQSTSSTDTTTTDKDHQGGGAIPTSGGGSDGGGTSAVGPTGDNGSGGKSLFAKAFDRLGPGNANSIPIPLIVLGSLALLLLAAGAAGMVARKLQERRPQPAPVRQRTTPDGPAV